MVEVHTRLIPFAAPNNLRVPTRNGFAAGCEARGYAPPSIVQITSGASPLVGRLQVALIP